MSFIIFLIYYFISTILLIVLLFLLWKFKLKKIISEKVALNTLNNFFNSDNDLSITDINIKEVNSNEQEESKIPTYF